MASLRTVASDPVGKLARPAFRLVEAQRSTLESPAAVVFPAGRSEGLRSLSEWSAPLPGCTMCHAFVHRYAGLAGRRDLTSRASSSRHAR